MPEQNPRSPRAVGAAHARPAGTRPPNVLLIALRALLVWASMGVAFAFVLSYMGGFHPSPLTYALPVLPALGLALGLWRTYTRRRHRLRGRSFASPSLRLGVVVAGPLMCGLLYLMLLYPVLGVVADAVGTAHWRAGEVVLWDPDHHYGRRSRTECTLVRARFVDGTGREVTMSQCLQDRDPAQVASGTALWVASRESLLGVVTPGVVDIGDRSTAHPSGAR